MDNLEFPVHKLPDIGMYGGDTVPWEIALIRDDGTRLPSSEASGYQCKLTFSPFSHGANAASTSPSLTKLGTIQAGTDGNAQVVFSFATQDTINLRGLFLYQIEIIHGADMRVAQGRLHIWQNINR